MHYELDYAMAGIDELAAEFVPCALGWKWWAKTFKKDLQNAKLELVDVLHFLASEDMVRSGNVDDDSLTLCVVRIAECHRQAQILHRTFVNSATDAAELESGSMLLMKRLTKNLLISLSDEQRPVDWTAYFLLCLLVGSDFFDQYRLYIGKAVLNRFRAENGYKTGTYIKKWQLVELTEPLEDNAHLTEWLSTQGEVTEVEIHAFLTETYARHIIAV